MSFNNHDEEDPNGKRYGAKREQTKNSNPAIDEISNLVKDRFFGLPMQEVWTKETYDEKKQRFSKLEDLLIEEIAKPENDKLMHVFTRWKDIRHELNEMYFDEIKKIIEVKENQINTDFKPL